MVSKNSSVKMSMKLQTNLLQLFMYCGGPGVGLPDKMQDAQLDLNKQNNE